jgi:hypothetical protein
MFTCRKKNGQFLWKNTYKTHKPFTKVLECKFIVTVSNFTITKDYLLKFLHLTNPMLFNLSLTNYKHFLNTSTFTHLFLRINYVYNTLLNVKQKLQVKHFFTKVIRLV